MNYKYLYEVNSHNVVASTYLDAMSAYVELIRDRTGKSNEHELDEGEEITIKMIGIVVNADVLKDS